MFRTPLRALLVALLALTVIAPALPAAAASKDDFDAVLAEALQARKEGNMTRVVQLLQKAYELRPAPELLNNLGRVYEEMGRYADAIETYQRVANDPKADSNLRALDAARIATLQAKRGKGWVLASVEPKTARLLVDGKPPAAPDGAEFPVDAGDRTIELIAADGTTARLIVRSFPLERRSEVSLTLAAGNRDGTLALGADGARPESLSVDGYRVRADLAAVQQIHVPSGAHRVSATYPGSKTVRVQVDVPPGGEVELAALLQNALSALPEDKPPEAPGPSAGPFILMGLGAVAGGVGAWLMVDAEGDRDQVRNADRDSRGVITSLTLAEAQQLEDDANLKGTVGPVLVGVGGAALVGGIAWLVVELTAEPETRGDVEVTVGPGSVGIAGRF